MARPSRGWGGVGARARAARPDGPQPTGPAARVRPRVGSRPAGVLAPAPPSFPGCGRGSWPSWGRLLLDPWLPGVPTSYSPPAPRRGDLQAATWRLAGRVARGRLGGPATVGTEPWFQVAFIRGWIGAWIVSRGARALAMDVQGGEGRKPSFCGLAGLVWSDAPGAGYLGSLPGNRLSAA